MLKLEAIRKWLFTGNRLCLVILSLAAAWMLLYPAIDSRLRNEKLVGDPAEYFAYLQSVFEDGDIQFSDDYLEFDPDTPTSHYEKLHTGYAPQIFAVGAPVLWSPFYLAGKLYVAATGVEARDTELDLLIRFARFGSRVYAALTLFLVYFILLHFFPRGPSLLASLAAFFCTPFYFYGIYNVINSHAAGAFGVALFLWYALKTGSARKTGQWIVLGLLLGLAALIRWQNGVIVIWILIEQLPVLWEKIKARSGVLKQIGRYAVAGVFAIPVFLIQILIWTVIFGPFKTPLDFGANHVIWERPEIINLLFSSRHGLFSWHPITYLALIGIVLWLWKKTGPALGALLAFLAMLYLNSITGDWWAGDSFGMRRFVSMAPVFAVGIAVLIDRISERWRRVGDSAAWVCVLLLVLLNISMAVRFFEADLQHDEAVGYGSIIGGSAGQIVDQTIWPFAFPGNVIQSLQTDNATFKDADWIASTQLDSLQNSLEGEIRAEYPSFRSGFSTTLEDNEGAHRVLSGLSGNVYFSVFTEYPRSRLIAEARTRRLNIGKDEIPVVEVILNGVSLKPLLGSARTRLARSETLVPIPAWRFGINKLEFRLWVGRTSKSRLYRSRNFSIAREETLRPNEGDYELKIYHLNFEEFVKKP